MILPSPLLTLLIGLAGATGAVARYLFGRIVAERINTQIPLGTLLINVSGAFLIGLVFALARQRIISSMLQAVLATGFLGGFTTFSTMSWEGLQLIRGGSMRVSLLYLLGSAALGLAAVGLGFVVGTAL